MSSVTAGKDGGTGRWYLSTASITPPLYSAVIPGESQGVIGPQEAVACGGRMGELTFHGDCRVYIGVLCLKKGELSSPRMLQYTTLRYVCLPPACGSQVNREMEYFSGVVYTNTPRHAALSRGHLTQCIVQHAPVHHPPTQNSAARAAGNRARIYNAVYFTSKCECPPVPCGTPVPPTGAVVLFPLLMKCCLQAGGNRAWRGGGTGAVSPTLR